MNDIHVLPVNDWIEHVEVRQCVCRPDVDESESASVVVHHAADGREHFEPEPE